MTVLKCVGGPHDGEWHSVGDGHTDLVIQPRFDLLGADAVMTLTRYTVRTLSMYVDALDGSNVVADEIRYLAPEEWSDMQAVRHQFSK
jgi:hypothetical protein